jgi:hypothetical protein
MVMAVMVMAVVAMTVAAMAVAAVIVMVVEIGTAGITAAERKADMAEGAGDGANMEATGAEVIEAAKTCGRIAVGMDAATLTTETPVAPAAASTYGQDHAMEI